MKNNDAEALLLNSTSLEDLIKMKIEKEFLSDLHKAKQAITKKKIENLKDVPSDKIFSKFTVFRCFNRSTGCETFINGIQAEGLIGIQNNVREKMLSGELNAFTTDEVYVKFEKAEL